MSVARRRPRQARARKRVDALLDAAARVLAEGGYPALNTNRVAAEAGVSVGSIYQYFSNKEQLVHALALRSLERLDAALDRLVPAPDADLDWEALVDQVLEALARLYREEPGFTSVWLGGLVSSELAEEDRAHDEQLVKRMLPFLQRIAPGVSRARLTRVGRMFVQVAGAVLALASRASAREARLVLAEGQRLLKGYLRDVIDPQPPRSR